ncbi:MAG: hypothetical protein ABI619_09965, partial [Betaproteobacteria bacterium]
TTSNWPSIVDVTSDYTFHDPGTYDTYGTGDDYGASTLNAGATYQNWSGSYEYVPVGLQYGPQTIY